jgi:dipeptidyl-peptidase-4
MKRLLVLLLLATIATAQSKPLTIEAIFADGGLTGRAPEGYQWSPDGTKLSFVQRDDSGEHGELWYIDTATGQKSVLVSEAKLASLAPPLSKVSDEREKERLTRYSVAAYHWAPDSRHILFDSHGQLWLYSLENGTAIQFTSSPEPSDDPKFSPDGKQVSFIRQHNLVVRSTDGNKERQLTSEKDAPNKDAASGDILNGEADWVYTEELEVRSNQFWSPDSRHIAFLQMDQSRVPTYPITDWMPTHPRVDNEKYPKVGDPNPTVRLGVADANSGKIKWITPFKDGSPLALDSYLPRFGWVREGVVWAQVLNRKQNQLDLYFIDVNSGRSRKVLSETSDAWIYVRDDFQILKSSAEGRANFLWSSWRDGHTHLYLYSFNQSDPLTEDAKLERQLTHGDFEVLSVEAVAKAAQPDASTVFFTANEGDVRQRHAYSVQLNGSSFHRLNEGSSTEHATFSDDGKYFVSTVSSTLRPPVTAYCVVNAACTKFWEARSIAAYAFTPPKFLDFKAEDGTVLHGQLTLPAASTGKVPLVLYIYGGPAAQTVVDSGTDTFAYFHQLLVQSGFAVFTLDNRGSPNRDKKFSAAIQGQFGAIEFKDQLSALDRLLADYPQLDKARVGIWGWSNGGSMTLYAMTHSDRFRAGVSVAPVTDQRNYDSIYTERYMGLLNENAKGYEGSAIAKTAANLYGSLLLVHGTSDDNVHFQNSIQMIDAFIKAGKQFQLMLYPNKTHGISGPAARSHLFHMIENHFEHELMPAK